MQSGLGEREERVPFPVFVRIRAPFSDEGTQSHISIPPPPPPSTSLHSGSSVPRRLEVSLLKHSPHERSSHVVDNSRSSLAFTFTRVFGPNSQQDEVFSESVKPHVAKCLQEGRPLCICAYGQTGSGKTYSMFGGGKYANRGIVQRTITQVFSYVDAVAAAAASSSTPSSSSSFLDDDIEDERTRVREANGASSSSSSSSSSSHVDVGQLTLRVRLSCLQIYNEQAFDLLDERQQGLPVEKWKPLQVVVSSSSSSGGGGGGGSSSSMNNNSGNNSVPVRGLRVYDVASEADALTLLLLAHVNRTTAATPMNLASSRSHCLLSISVDTIASTGICLKSTQITLVDLAGSERVYKTGTGAPAAAEAAEATGSRKVGQRRTREGKMINLSLHHLQQCIVALQQRTPQHTANSIIKPSSVETQDEMNSNHHHHYHHHPRFSISSSASSSSSYFFKSRDSIGSVASSGHVSESSSIASRSRASSILSGLMAIPSAVSSSSSSSSLHNNAQSSSSSSSSSLSRHTHVPFRNSVLTIALKDFLDGKSLTVFIATLNPEAQYTDESVSTLRFAARCAVLSADVSIPKRRGTDSGNSSANTSITGAAASSLSSSSSAAAPPPLPPPFLSNPPRGVSTSRSSDAHAKNDDASAFLRLSRDKEALIAELQRAITRAETAEGALDLIRDSNALQEEREIQSALLKLNERQLRRNDTRAVYPQDALPVTPESMSNAIESHTTNNQNQSSSSSLTLTENEKKSTEEAVAHYVKVLMKSAVASAVQAAAEAIVSADNNNTAALSIAVSSSSSSSSSLIQSEIDKEESHHLPYHLPTTTTTGVGVGRVSLSSSSSSSTSTILLPSSPTHGPQLPSQFKDLLLQGQVFLKYPSSKGSSILARPGLRSLYVDKHFKALHWKHLDTHSSLLQSSASSSEDLISDSSTGTNFGLISSIVDVSDGISVSPLVDSDSNSNNASSDKRSNARRSHHHNNNPSGVGGATLFITFKERVLDLEVPTLGASPEIAIRVRDLWRDALLWLAKESKVLLN